MSLEDLFKLKWEPRGRGPVGVDCVGLVILYARMAGFDIPDIDTTENRAGTSPTLQALCTSISSPVSELKNHAIFFEHNGVPCHVGVVLPDGRFLHAIYGGPRADNDLRLIERLGLKSMGSIPLGETPALISALKTSGLGDPVTWVVVIGLVISIALTAASIALAPKAPRFGSANGRYGYDALITQNRGDLPIPDLYGTVTLPGNSPFTEAMDKHEAVTDVALQKACKIVIFGLAPINDFGTGAFQFRINGLAYDDPYWFSSANSSGMELNPVQVKSEAITGTIGSDNHKPSVTLYSGAPRIDVSVDVPVDVRANYIREFPIYGFNGCAYAVFRLVDSARYSNFNVLARCRGRYIRSFDSSGLVKQAVQYVWYSPGPSRISLLHGSPPYDKADYVSADPITHDGNTYYEMGPSHQSGFVFRLNRHLGYIEFPFTVPGVGTGPITIEIVRYVLEENSNPASHIAQLLTDKIRGKGLPESKIDWPSFVAARDYCDATVTTQTESGPVTGPRYTSNYVMDQRRPIQDHLREFLNACRGMLLISNGKVKLKILRDNDTSIFSFNTTNIIEGSFSAELSDSTQRSNEIRLQFHDSTAFSGESTVVRGDVADQDNRVANGNEGVRSEALKYAAVDNEAQARRLADQVISAELDIAWMISFATSIKGLALEPGDIIDVTHPAQPRWTAKLFRVDETNISETDQIEIRASEYLPA